MCYDCFAPVFTELELGATPPPMAPPATARDRPRHGLDLREDAPRAGGTDAMADLARDRALLAHPAHAPPTPRAYNEAIALLQRRVLRAECAVFSLEIAIPFPQLLYPPFHRRTRSSSKVCAGRQPCTSVSLKGGDPSNREERCQDAQGKSVPVM